MKSLVLIILTFGLTVSLPALANDTEEDNGNGPLVYVTGLATAASAGLSWLSLDNDMSAARYLNDSPHRYISPAYYNSVRQFNGAIVVYDEPGPGHGQMVRRVERLKHPGELYAFQRHVRDNPAIVVRGILTSRSRAMLAATLIAGGATYLQVRPSEEGEYDSDEIPFSDDFGGFGFDQEDIEEGWEHISDR
jgi:hypothetical protein